MIKTTSYQGVCGISPKSQMIICTIKKVAKNASIMKPPVEAKFESKILQWIMRHGEVIVAFVNY